MDLTLLLRSVLQGSPGAVGGPVSSFAINKLKLLIIYKLVRYCQVLLLLCRLIDCVCNVCVRVRVYAWHSRANNQYFGDDPHNDLNP